MIREEIQDKKDFIKVCNETAGNFLEWAKTAEQELAYLEKQLAELEVEVYKPIYLSQSGHNYAITKNGKSGSALEKYLDRHNAGEELKKLISEENTKQGWKIDWNLDQQKKHFIIGYDYVEKDIEVHWDDTFQAQESELYFSEQSSQDQDFLDKIKPLWLKWKGIN